MCHICITFLCENVTISIDTVLILYYYFISNTYIRFFLTLSVPMTEIL